MTKRRSAGGGFTLVELLVVIGILALLISILLPALSRARQQGMRTVCLAHLHEWGAGFAMYAQDNKGFIALEEVRDWTGPTRGTWMEWCGYHVYIDYSLGGAGVFKNDDSLLNRYLSHPEKIVDCPALVQDIALYDQNQGSTYAVANTSPSYGISFNLGTTSAMTAANKYVAGCNITSVRDSSETLLLADCANWGGTSLTRNILIPSPFYTSGSAPAPEFHGRHPGGGNVLWFDGHVTTEPARPLTSGETVNTVQALTAAGYNAIKLGYLMPPGIQQNNPKANFYFWFDKAKGNYNYNGLPANGQ